MTEALAVGTITPLVKYELTDEQIQATRERYAALEATTPQGYEEVRQAIAVVRGTRTGVEKRRVELKAAALAYGRTVDEEAKRLTALIASIEDPLVAKKQAVDDEKARIKAEQEATKLREIEARLAAEREVEEARLKAIRDEEEKRLADERARLAAEREQLAEERRQVEAARAAERAIEDAKLDAQREQEGQARATEDAQRAAENARLQAEREAIDRERRELEETRRKAEREEFERQAAIKAEKDAADRIETERIAQLERDARIAAVLPDAKKLDVFAAVIRALPAPSVKTKAAKAAIAKALQGLEQIASDLTGIEKQVA